MLEERNVEMLSHAFTFSFVFCRNTYQIFVIADNIVKLLCNCLVRIYCPRRMIVDIFIIFGTPRLSNLQGR